MCECDFVAGGGGASNGITRVICLATCTRPAKHQIFALPTLHLFTIHDYSIHGNSRLTIDDSRLIQFTAIHD